MNIIYFNSTAEYQSFVTSGSITKEGVTYPYQPAKDIYLVKTNNGSTVLGHSITIGSKSFNNTADVEVNKSDLGLGNVTNVNAETLVSALETAIRSLIPSQATSSNQLADKAFVNSSIATSTSNFLGTVDVKDDLDLSYGETNVDDDDTPIANKLTTIFTNPTVNDYCFVIDYEDFNEPASKVFYRFKCTTGGSNPVFMYEYTLNNSSFTAVQWNALNSGITSALVAKITPTETAVAGLQTSKLDKVSTANIVYGTDNNGAAKSYSVSSAANANSVALRTSSGSLRVTVPATPDNGDAINKGYLDTKLGEKVSKISGTGSIRVYAVGTDGAQTSITASNSATANTIAYRGTNGVLPVGNPVSDTDAATKYYVDNFVKQVVV